MTAAKIQALLWWAAVGAYSVVVAVLSLTPSSCLTPSPFPHADKVVHFCIYAMFMLILQRALGRPHLTSRRCMGAFLFCTAYGLLMECCQYAFRIAGRTFSFADIAANVAGAAVAAVLVCCWCTSPDGRDPSPCTLAQEPE